MTPEAMSKTDVAVWSFDSQCFIPFAPCPGEKRVRIAHDDLGDYAVYPAIYRGDGTFELASRDALEDWEISFS